VVENRGALRIANRSFLGAPVRSRGARRFGSCRRLRLRFLLTLAIDRLSEDLEIRCAVSTMSGPIALRMDNPPPFEVQEGVRVNAEGIPT